MSGRDGRRRVLSYDERALWRAVTGSIVPLHETPTLDDDGIDAAPTVPPPATAKQRGLNSAAMPVSPAPAVKPSAPPLAPLGRRMRQRVARGKEPIDARLDLHGLTQAQAHGTLLRFLTHASARGARLVLVITGKGARSDRSHGSMHGEGERGVLKRQVPHWLGMPDFRALVIGFEDAHIGHGGEGALYVRLRRARD